MARIVADPRRVLLVLLVAGLAASITLSQTMLVVLTLWLLREWHRGRLALTWPLAVPIAAFAGWSILSALLSEAPAESLRASHSLIGLGTLWVVLHAVEDGRRARGFATPVVGAGVAVAARSVVQVAPGSPQRVTAKAVRHGEPAATIGSGPNRGHILVRSFFLRRTVRENGRRAADKFERRHFHHLGLGQNGPQLPAPA